MLKRQLLNVLTDYSDPTTRIREKYPFKIYLYPVQIPHKSQQHSKVVRDRVEEDARTRETPSSCFTTNPDIDPKSEPPQKDKTSVVANILGCNWNVESDTFNFGLNELIAYAETLPPTKRSVLKALVKIFDPVGILSPFTVNLKILFQLLCCDRVEWDEELDEKALTFWKSLVEGLKSINLIEIPRCYFSCFGAVIKSQKIHGLSDASEKAYTAVVYSGTEYKNGQVEINLVASKNTNTKAVHS